MMKAKVIKNEKEYEDALDYIYSLMDAEPGSPEEGELELFSLLVEVYEKEHYPIELPDPIEAIKFRMDQEGLKRKDIAKYIGSPSRVSEVFNGKRSLSLSMIRSLHSGLNIPAEVLLQESGKRLVDCKYKLSDYPFNEMFKKGYFNSFKGNLSKAKDFSEELLGNLFSVFGELEPEFIYCRKSKDKVDSLALKAWQARAISLLKEEVVEPYRKENITKSFLQDIVKLSQFIEGPKLVKELLNKKGVHFIILPHLDKTYLDGACFCMPGGKPVIAMSLRYDRTDNFWFTLLHELAHLLLHLDGENIAFFDDIENGDKKSNKYEKEADKLCRKLLIADNIWKNIKKKSTNELSDYWIKTLANELGISPAIIAGRLRWEKKDYSLYSALIGNKSVRKLF